jgi:hypothetical protein
LTAKVPTCLISCSWCCMPLVRVLAWVRDAASMLVHAAAPICSLYINCMHCTGVPCRSQGLPFGCRGSGTPEQSASRSGKGGGRAFRIHRVSPGTGSSTGVVWVHGSSVYASSTVARRETNAALNIGVGNSTARLHGNEGWRRAQAAQRVLCIRRVSLEGTLTGLATSQPSVERDVCSAKP